MATRQPIRPFALALHVLALAPAALAQFAEPSPTSFKEKIVGQVVALTGTPDPAAGDMIGAFYDTNKLCGRFVFTGTATTRAFDITLNGDVASTAAVKEGPTRGQRVTFQFYDASANTTLPMTVLTTAGEVFNLTFQGADVPPIPVPIDLTPSRDFNLRIGSTSGGGDGNGNGNGNNTNRYDIDGNGKVDHKDAAYILRISVAVNVQPPSAAQPTTAQSGTGVQASQQTEGTNAPATNDLVRLADEPDVALSVSKMDVNRDGRVDVNDAIEVIRNKDAG